MPIYGWALVSELTLPKSSKTPKRDGLYGGGVPLVVDIEKALYQLQMGKVSCVVDGVKGFRSLAYPEKSSGGKLG